MVRKKSWTKAVLTVAFFTCTYLCAAQFPDPFDDPPEDLPTDDDNPGGFDGEPPDFAPIDSDIGYLMALGLLYGARCLIRKSVKKEVASR